MSSSQPDPSEPQSNTKSRSLVLLAEDDADMRQLVAMVLRATGCEVITAQDGYELWQVLTGELRSDSPLGTVSVRPARLPAVVVSDVRMPGASGFDVLAELRDRHIDVPFVIITASSDPQTRAEAARLGVRALLEKPFDLSELSSVVTSLLTQ